MRRGRALINGERKKDMGENREIKMKEWTECFEGLSKGMKKRVNWECRKREN